MSREDNVERTELEQERKQDSACSSNNAAPPDAVSHGAEESVSGEVTAATTEHRSEAPAGQDAQSPHSVDLGASQATLESRTMAPNESFSKQLEYEEPTSPLEPLAQLSVPSKHRSEMPLSPSSAFRSLTLQVSPGKHNQERSPSLKMKSSPPGGQARIPEEPSVIPNPHEALPANYSWSSSIWDAFSLGASNTRSSAETLSSASFPGNYQPRYVPQPLTQNKKTLLEGPSIPATAIDETPLTMEVRAETYEHSRAVPSPRAIVPRSDTPRRLERMRETPEVVHEPVSPLSPVSVASPNSLTCPRRTKAAFSRLLLDEAYVPPRVPWATLIVTWMQVQSHWNYLHKHYPERCASVLAIVDMGHWERVPLAALHHKDSVHLTLNLVSFLVKAIVLEAAFGMTYFSAVLTIVAILVGLVNTLVLYFASKFIMGSLRTTCLHTFAGVNIALGMVGSKHFTHSLIHYDKFVFKIWPLFSVVVESILLLVFSYKDFLPMVSGLLVGLFLAYTAVGNFVISVRFPRQHLHLCVLPKTPVTFLLMASIIAAYAYGPYPLLPVEPALTFRNYVWNLRMLRILYLPNVFMMCYVVLSILPVGVQLEQEIGHCSFFVLFTGLLFATNASRDSLSWILQKHQVAFRKALPAPVPHSVSCNCGMAGALLSLKAFHHMRHPKSDYQMASFPIPVPFWAGVLIELMHLEWSMPRGSTFGHVVGFILGLAVGHCRSEYFANCIPGVGSFSASSTPQYCSESLAH